MNEDYFRSISTILPPNLDNKVVLDLCCNAGFVSFKLAEKGAKVTAIDSSEYYIDQAHYVMNKVGLPKVKFLIMDIEELEPKFYNPYLIVFLSCLYHLKDPKKFVQKLNDLSCYLLVSFRKQNYNQYIKMFDKEIISETEYGNKRAVLLT